MPACWIPAPFEHVIAGFSLHPNPVLQNVILWRRYQAEKQFIAAVNGPDSVNERKYDEAHACSLCCVDVSNVAQLLTSGRHWALCTPDGA